ncbi:hypothetical protein O9X98_11075 [Agrobacterium salinitolerans]|nr:hypothetical protein [Agrobacterium salinitolerans]
MQDPKTAQSVGTVTFDMVMLMILVGAEVILFVLIIALFLCDLLGVDRANSFVVATSGAAFNTMIATGVGLLVLAFRLPWIVKNEAAYWDAKDKQRRDQATRLERLERKSIYRGNRKFGDSLLDYIPQD